MLASKKQALVCQSRQNLFVLFVQRAHIILNSVASRLQIARPKIKRRDSVKVTLSIKFLLLDVPNAILAKNTGMAVKYVKQTALGHEIEIILPENFNYGPQNSFSYQIPGLTYGVDFTATLVQQVGNSFYVDLNFE
jgi:hypothetical protein